MKRFVLFTVFLLTALAFLAVAQTRESNPPKKRFSFSSFTIPASREWVKENDRWSSRSSAYFNRFRDFSTRNESGFGGYFSIRLVSFRIDTTDVYALRYVYATLHESYEHSRKKVFPFIKHEYFFISKADVIRLTDLVEDIEISIMPYHSIEVSPSEDKEDAIINSYLSYSKSYWPRWDCKWKLTTQKNRKVVRFTLPYMKEKADIRVFECGPYYEISQTQFTRFADSVRKHLEIP